jgi:hypothetical protein
MKYSNYIISNKPHLIPNIQQSIFPEKIIYFNGEGYTSFSKLVNACVESCETETIILMSDKVLPTPAHVKKVLDLLSQGYAFVALYRFAFFGFNKELFRRIGPLDERFIGGGYEDDDFYLRLYEANLSMYITEEVPYERKESSWNYSLSKDHFLNKWHSDPIARNLQEETYSYNFGSTTNRKFLEWNNSYITPMKIKRWFMKPMIINGKVKPGPIKPKGKL